MRGGWKEGNGSGWLYVKVKDLTAMEVNAGKKYHHSGNVKEMHPHPQSLQSGGETLPPRAFPMKLSIPKDFKKKQKGPVVTKKNPEGGQGATIGSAGRRIKISTNNEGRRKEDFQKRGGPCNCNNP